MGSFSNYYENIILDLIFGGGAYVPPISLYMALLNSAPDDTSTGSTISETTYTGYARKEVTNNDTNFPDAVGGAKANGTEIIFNECTGGSDTITHFAVVDASSGGNVVVWGTLDTAKPISVGDTPKFGIGDLDITLD